MVCNWARDKTPRGASAIAHSLVETAKENGLDLYLYLEYLFERIPNIQTDERAAMYDVLMWSERLPERIHGRTKKHRMRNDPAGSPLGLFVTHEFGELWREGKVGAI